MIIYTDYNGVAVSAAEGPDIEGHVYLVRTGDVTHKVEFQQGAVAEHGVTGLTNEALLAILIHRTRLLDLRCPCEENRMAISAMTSALSEFETRATRQREREAGAMLIV